MIRKHLKNQNIMQTTMRSLTLAAILMTLGLLVPISAALANCPNGCECNDDTLVVKCGEGSLDVLPIALNPSLKRLVIKNNRIKTIDSSVQFYAALTFLDLSYNELMNIPPRTFAYQRNLQELHLNHNKIGQISNMTFYGLVSVTVLNLRGNLLAELENGAFSIMSKVEELNLGQNRISRIDEHAFDGLPNLRVLYLDDNTLTTVPGSITFRAMPSLAELFLGTNSFASVPDQAFVDLKGLTRLDLKGAGLHNITTESLKGLSGLRYLDLSDNRLTKVPTAALGQLERLEELSLGQNDFDIIGPTAFAGLKYLKRIEITGAARLQRVAAEAFSSNTNLEFLNLSSNKMLSQFDENALSGGLPHLKTVILKENNLGTLAAGLFPWSDLHQFDLSDNPLICDCRLLWLQHLLTTKNTSSDIKFPAVLCAFPERLKEQSLTQVTPAQLGCSHSDAKHQAMIGVLLVVTAATITALALILYACRRRIREALKGGWGNSALGRKEREYQKTCSDEEYMTRQQQQLPCHLGYGGASAPYGGNNYNHSQYMGSRPIPVTEL